MKIYFQFCVDLFLDRFVTKNYTYMYIIIIFLLIIKGWLVFFYLIKYLWVIKCKHSPLIYFKNAQVPTVIIVWWYRCRKEIWFCFLRSTKNIWKLVTMWIKNLICIYNKSNMPIILKLLINYLLCQVARQTLTLSNTRPSNQTGTKQE